MSAASPPLQAPCPRRAPDRGSHGLVAIAVRRFADGFQASGGSRRANPRASDPARPRDAPVAAVRASVGRTVESAGCAEPSRASQPLDAGRAVPSSNDCVPVAAPAAPRCRAPGARRRRRGRRLAERGGDRLHGGSAAIRLGEIAAIASARLVLEAVGHRQHPRRGHLDRHQAGMRRVHQREADVVLAQELGVGALVGARQQFQRRAAAEVDAAAAARRAPMPCSSQPAEARRRSSARSSASTPELEHVARRVGLGARVEEQPARRARRRARRRRRRRSP